MVRSLYKLVTVDRQLDLPELILFIQQALEDLLLVLLELEDGCLLDEPEMP